MSASSFFHPTGNREHRSWFTFALARRRSRSAIDSGGSNVSVASGAGRTGEWIIFGLALIAALWVGSAAFAPESVDESAEDAPLYAPNFGGP